MNSHIGLNFSNKFAKLFSFQLLGIGDESGTAVAFVDFENGQPTRFGAIPKLLGRKEAILKLAGIYQRKYQA